MKHKIAVQYADDVSEAPDELKIRQWANAAVTACESPVELNIRVVGEEEGLALNTRYRGANKATNVLSFQADLSPELLEKLFEDDECSPLGDLVLCAPVIVQQAIEQGKPEAHHWAHLVVHGALHLQGYDHAEEHDARIMEHREIEVLATLGIPDPY